MGIADLVVAPILKIIDKVIPDPAQRDAAKLALAQLQQNGELAQMQADSAIAQGQIAINKADAEKGTVFQAGWRPMVGWICAIGLGFQFIVKPLATWGATIAGHPVDLPSLDLGTLMTLLFGMLGMGALRTTEKLNGVAAK